MEQESEEFQDAWEDAKEQVMVEVKKKFPPELINRLDDLLVRHPVLIPPTSPHLSGSSRTRNF